MAGKRVRHDILSDRISNMPCNVIDCILMRLPLEDAVRTSVLSMQWRHNWLTIPKLTFNYINGREFIVSHVLMRHKGPITKFSFKNEDGDNDIDIVGDWLQFLSSHSCIEDFKLRLNADKFYVMPQSLFSFEHLRHLHLYGVKIKLPSTFKGFNRLVTLTLEKISNTFDMVTTLTSKCPMLEILTVEDFNDEELVCLDIVGPNLETFDFYGFFYSICLKCPSIKEVSLQFYWFGYVDESPVFDNFEWPDSCGSKSNLVKVFYQMPSVEHVKLQVCFLLQFLAVGGVPQELPNKLNHLTRLDMDVEALGHKKYVSFVACLIRSSPNLKHLQISSNTEKSKPDAIQYLKAQQECKVQLHCLKNVKIDRISNEKSDLEFVKLLLLWASALEKLEARLGLSKGRVRVIQQLASFPRASSDAVLVFK